MISPIRTTHKCIDWRLATPDSLRLGRAQLNAARNDLAFIIDRADSSDDVHTGQRTHNLLTLSFLQPPPEESPLEVAITVVSLSRLGGKYHGYAALSSR